MNLSSMKVGTRLGLGFGLILVFLQSISALGISGMTKVQERLDEIVNDNVHKLQLVQTMSESVHSVSRVTRTLVLLNDTAAIEQEIKKISDARDARSR